MTELTQRGACRIWLWTLWMEEERHCRQRRGVDETMAVHKGAMQDWGSFLWALPVLGVSLEVSEEVIRSHTLSLIPSCMDEEQKCELEWHLSWL